MKKKKEKIVCYRDGVTAQVMHIGTMNRHYVVTEDSYSIYLKRIGSQRAAKKYDKDEYEIAIS